MELTPATEIVPATEIMPATEGTPLTPLTSATPTEEEKQEETPTEQGVVKVGEVTYETIAEALEQETADTVEITLAGSLTEDVTIPEGKTVILDLAGHTLTGTVESKGKLTIQDGTAPSTPEVSSDYTTVTYDSGKITSTGRTVTASNGGTVILESGMIESTKRQGVFAKGFATEGTTQSVVEVKGGYVLAQEFAAEAQGYGAVLNISGGVLKAKDNAVVGGQGLSPGTEINITGGTMIGNIQTGGYIACGIYHPQAGELNITGGTIYVHGGVGVLVRAGVLHMTGGEIIATGNANGKVGDSNILASGYGVQVDEKAAYPGAKVELKAEIEGGSVAGEQGAVNLIAKDDAAETNKEKIDVSGGEFSSSVDSIFLAEGLKYEAEDKGVFTYHKELKDAQEAGGTVTQVKDENDNPVAPDAEKVTVTIDPKNGDAITTLKVVKGGKINVDDLDTPTRSRYRFRGWVVDGQSVSGEIEAKDGMTIEAQWKKKSSSSSSSSSSKTEYSINIDEDIDNGKVKADSSKAEKGDKVTITVTPDKGYEVDKVIVRDADDEKLDVKDEGKGEYTFKMPDSKVEIDVKFVKADEAEDKPEISEEAKTIILTIDQRIASVDGEYVVNDVAPIIRNERTMLPIRFIAKELGAEVAWDDALDKVTITKDDLTIELYIGAPVAVVNGENVTLDAPAFIENSRTYLPLRFVAENLGATVTWDAETQQVTIVADK